MHQARFHLCDSCIWAETGRAEQKVLADPTENETRSVDVRAKMVWARVAFERGVRWCFWWIWVVQGWLRVG